MKRLLIVVDYQKDFVDGALGFPGAEALDEPIAEKIAAYEADAQAQYEYYGMTEADSRPTDAGEGI